MPQRGLFLSLDGVDGAGKSTQCRLLAEWLRAQGWTVTTCRDPGGTAAGERIRSILLDRDSRLNVLTETLLYMASRSELLDQVIRPALEQGQLVLSDRYLLSTVVYQGHAGALPPEEIWRLGTFAAGGLLPDLTLILDLPLSLTLQRRKGPADRMEAKGEVFLEKVRQGFLAEARLHPERMRVVDATPDVATVQQALQREVSRVLVNHPRP
jgi:dTMP kinase